MRYDRNNREHRWMVNRGHAFIDSNGNLVEIRSPDRQTPLIERMRRVAENVQHAREIFTRSPNTPIRFTQKN